MSCHSVQGDLLVLAKGDDFAERKNLSRNFILLSDSLDVRLMDSKAGFLATAALVAVIVMAALGSDPAVTGSFAIARRLLGGRRCEC